MSKDTTDKMRCLAQIATLGGLAKPGMSGAEYRLTLSLIEDESGSPVDGTIEAHFEDFDDRLEQALVDATKLWVEFVPAETEMRARGKASHVRGNNRRLHVLAAENVEIHWDDGPRVGRRECPECHGTGEIDISIGPRRIVSCKRCNGVGTLASSE